jgi:hypothetical protein
MDFVTIALILSILFFAKGIFIYYKKIIKDLNKIKDDYYEDCIKYKKLWESQKVSTNRYKSQLTRRNKRIANLLLKIETLCKK